MNRFRLVHVTEFAYEAPVSESYNEVHLQPHDDERQNCIAFKLRTNPPSAPSSSRDYFGNWVHRFNIMPKHRGLRVEAESVVMVAQPEPVDDPGTQLSEVAGVRPALLEEHYDFLTASPYVPETAALSTLAVLAEEASSGSALEFARAAARVIHDRFRYEKGATHVHSSIEEVIRLGAGVCQDFAHLLIGLARWRGLPARYVSGYLVPKKVRDGAVPAGKSMEQVAGGHASHAWVEVFVPGAGWIGLDSTLGMEVTGHHIRVAYGRDYGDVAPVRGIYKGHAGQRLSVDVRVRPALDTEGHEHLRETAAVPAAERAVEEAPPQQLAQQEQQQQQQQQ